MSQAQSAAITDTGQKEQVLLVDDEENVLSAYKRTLHGRFKVDTALSGPLALQLIEENGPYPVIVSDMRMPEMSGVELLSEVKRRCSDTVRILLTGNTDQETAVQAINEGDVFRFLNKPCTPTELAGAISTAMDHHRLIIAERELLEETLKGSIDVLIETLSLARPDVLGQTMRLKQLLQGMMAVVDLPLEAWKLETAALLSQLGYVTLSQNLVEHIQSGQKVLPEEQEKIDEAVGLAAGMIEKIPRLESIAEMIRFQDKCYDGSGPPQGFVGGEAIPAGARMLKCALDYDRCLTRALSRQEAILFMERNAHHYDPDIFAALKESVSIERTGSVVSVAISALRSSMIVAEDVCTTAGLLIVPKGLDVSDSVHAHLRRFLESGQIEDQILVMDRA